VNTPTEPPPPIRFQHRRVKGFRSPPPFKVVTRGRRSRYGNPFRLTKDQQGDPAAHALVVAQFREWITSPAQAELLAEARRELRGLNLGCTCPIGLPCHADVLLELVNQGESST
jgi:Domain of unknown function (DUF4326)